MSVSLFELLGRFLAISYGCKNINIKLYRIIRLNMSNTSKKETNFCVYLLKTKEETLVFCLRYRFWIEQCPIKCAFFLEGIPGSMSEVEQKKIDIDCIYCTRKCPSDLQKSIFYCTSLDHPEPSCELCHSAVYPKDFLRQEGV